MKRITIKEWGYLDVSDGHIAASAPRPSVTRAEADQLTRAASYAASLLKLGDDSGSAILTRGHKTIRAGQIAGVISTADVSMEILPKIDGLDDGSTRQNLVRMLARVFDLKIADGALTGMGWQRHDLLEVLIRIFCDHLFAAVHRGLPRRYVPLEDDLRALKGRLKLKRQFTSLAVSPQKLACRYEELSADIPLNQVMKAAVSKLRKITKVSDNQRRLYELELAFADVSDVPVGLLQWGAIVIDRTNRAWRELLTLAQLLLGQRYQNTALGSQAGFTLLFEMNTLFEEFVGRSLQRALHKTGAKVRLQGPRDFALIDVQGPRRFATKPDIHITFPNGATAIVDTKWKQLTNGLEDPKRGVSQGDIYQMIAYGQVYVSQRLMLLYPHHGSLKVPAGCVAAFSVSGNEETRLEVATVDLGSMSRVEEALSVLMASAV